MTKLSDIRILLAGGHGFLGSVLRKKLIDLGAIVMSPSREELELCDYDAVLKYFFDHRVDIVINAAGVVGGILYNMKNAADLFYWNHLPGFNLLHAASFEDIKKFVQVGTVCEYPDDARCPLKESSIHDGLPNASNRTYAMAKRSLLEMGLGYRKQYGMNIIHPLLANLYGPGDDFSDACHVIPGMVKRFCDRKENPVICMGSGKPTRDFLYVDDAAEAIVHLISNYDEPEPINIGTGASISIKDLAEKISKLSDNPGTTEWDHTKPDGQYNRVLDVSKMRNLGWTYKIGVDEGLRRTIRWYMENNRG